MYSFFYKYLKAKYAEHHPKEQQRYAFRQTITSVFEWPPKNPVFTRNADVNVVTYSSLT